jgi:tRNA-(ms[2]io[6]A)-hydroxylase
MKFLRSDTPAAWLDTVLADFDTFLVDHAACERKASAMGMSFVVRYPDRTALIEPMIELAREELEHYHQVMRLILGRGIRITRDQKDPYINRLDELVRHGRDERLLDRLIFGGIVEARGSERFGLIARALEPGDLEEFYVSLATSEARHYLLFLDLAKRFFADDVVERRVDEFLDREAEIVDGLEIRSALH